MVYFHLNLGKNGFAEWVDDVRRRTSARFGETERCRCPACIYALLNINHLTQEMSLGKNGFAGRVDDVRRRTSARFGETGSEQGQLKQQ